jgi:hypothetical protein
MKGCDTWRALLGVRRLVATFTFNKRESYSLRCYWEVITE